MADEERLLLANRADSGLAADRLEQAWRDWRAPMLWGQKIVKLWSFILCCGLFATHQVCISDAPVTSAGVCALAAIPDTGTNTPRTAILKFAPGGSGCRSVC